MSDEKRSKNPIVDIAVAILGSEDFQTFMCGKYSDGTPRSFADAIKDEMYSPQQKKNKAKNDKKKKDKKKKKKKNKHKHDFYIEF